ncbi:mosc domain-containing protein [Diplodia corticola]|uniref:Mosc domain-containing protein n=1 Tax=Diplodia corticola TaxID=236234 RepID=A0A1J9S1T8_9PEZI|nr:mosc domain-containing protein [Diplodia corticola]OJD34543.1 mosc domain-containing protein [Diplodia corticola]
MGSLTDIMNTDDSTPPTTIPNDKEDDNNNNNNNNNSNTMNPHHHQPSSLPSSPPTWPTTSTTTLTQIRTGKVRTVPGTSIPSAIAKRPHRRPTPVRVSALGLAGDEQAFHKHGGPDKAVLQYCPAHYRAWRAELAGKLLRGNGNEDEGEDESDEHASALALFRPGGFGENFVAEEGDGMDEGSVCVGDVVEVGGGSEGGGGEGREGGGGRGGNGATQTLLLQVSLPRAPCYKLNHRFRVDGMARLAQETGRTGWYYRVLREGEVRVGDRMRLVERPCPRWSVRRVQEILHADKKNEGAVRELAGLEELGEEFRALFRNRLRKGFGDMGAENEEGRLWGSEKERLEVWRRFRVTAKRRETAAVASFVFEALEPAEGEEPPPPPPPPRMVKPGSHVRIKLRELVRSYSVVGGTSDCLEIGVALDDSSRGGSRYLHDRVSVGDCLELSGVNESFPLHAQAQKHVLIAGGIGITAFIPAARTLASQCIPWELHLCVRSEDDVPFRRYLEPLGKHLVVYSKADDNRLNVRKLVASQTAGTHVYCCGPERMMDAVTEAAESLNFPKENVHFEAFTANLTGDPFSVGLTKSGRCLDVPANDTLLDVLRESGFDVPSSCEVGNCATCVVKLVSGRVDHRGTALQEDEKRGNMLSCVSRGVAKIEIEL